MKTTPSLISRLLATCVAVVVIFSACKKQENSAGTSGQEEFAAATAETEATAESVFDDAFNNAMGVNTEVGIGGTGVFGRQNVSTTSNGRLTGVDSTTCYSVAITQLSTATRFPLQITIDFGAGCTDRNGRIRKGKIIIVYTGRLINPGNSASLTFDGYYVDDIKVEGTQKITNIGTVDKKSYNILVVNAKLSQSNGNTCQWNSEKTISQTDGMLTPALAIDDAFAITGAASGSVQKGDKYFQWSTIITTPLTKRYACRWISKGTITLNKGNAAVAVLDYGPGTCDNRAIFSVNNVDHEITLH
jgi:hypothetical protein